MKNILVYLFMALAVSVCAPDITPEPEPKPEKNLDVSMGAAQVTLPYGVPTDVSFTYKNAAGGLKTSFSNLPADVVADSEITSTSGKLIFTSSVNENKEFNTTVVFSDGKTEVSKSLKLCTVKKEESKTVVLAFAQQSITIHDASINKASTLAFTLENATADTQVTVTPAEGLDASATIDKDLKGGVLTVKATGEFTDGCKLAVTASDGAVGDTKEITVNKYYLTLSCDNENIVIDNELRTIRCTTYKDIKDVQINISTNFSTSVKAIDNGWLKVTNQLLVSVGWNDKQEARSETLTIRANPGGLDYDYTVSQVAGVDEFELERQALIELWKALDGPNWKSQGGLGNCHTRNWNTDAPVEDWYGVELYNEFQKYPGHVQAIVLSTFAPKGELPECIENFRYLDEFECHGGDDISFRGTEIKGKVPKAFSKLPLLRKLNISDNKFEEELETSALKDVMLNCPNLERLAIQNNNFTGKVPEWLSEMKETHQGSAQKSAYSIGGNRLEGKVPEKVINHWQWQRPWLYDSTYKTYGESFIKSQQPGYILYE